MSILSAVAFERLCVPMGDGVPLLPRQRVAQAAHDAGYSVSNASIQAALANSSKPHYMTATEFDNFCASNQSSFVSPDAMAHALVVIAPSNVITRASLEALMQRNAAASASSPSTDVLSAEEVDALFESLDTTCSGAITGDDLMRAFHGEAGVRTLQQVRRSEVEEAKARAQAAEVAAAARAQAEAAAARERELQRVRDEEQRAAAARLKQSQNEEAERQRREATAAAARAKKTKTCC